MVNIVLILIALRPKYCQEKVEHSISKHLNFKIFWGGTPPDPLGSSHLRHSKNRLLPSFRVGTSTSKLTDSTDLERSFHDFTEPCKVPFYNPGQQN